MHTKTVLILDRDLGFVFWLGQMITKAGYQAFPANSCDSANELVRHLNLGIDMLIVSYSIPGAGGFVHSLLQSQKHLKVIAVLDAGDKPVSAFAGADATEHKPSPTDEPSAAKWLATVKSAFARDRARTRIVSPKAAKSS
jgi:DNA-binding NtrC family response regulator